VAFALSSGMFGLQASDLNLVTAVLVAIALIAPKLKGNMAIKKPVNSGESGGKQKSGGAL
ncbi:ABC transporter permease, partial [Vibrio vulnificus]